MLGATTRLRAGTGVHLLPLWELDTERAAVATLLRLAGQRLELGVGLGYRDEEFDGFGLPRRQRGRLMDAALDQLTESWGDSGAAPPIMVGGFSDAALRRAGSRGLGIFLPFSFELDKLRAIVELYREHATAAGHCPGRIGMLKFVRVTDGSEREFEHARAAIIGSAREYTGAWFPMGGTVGFLAPQSLARQLALAANTAFIGPPQAITARLEELAEVGIDVVVLQVMRDDQAVDYRGDMEALAEHVLPAIAVA